MNGFLMREIKIQSKYILITGASKGLGYYLACEYWASGYNIFITSSNSIDLKKIAKSFPSKKNQSLFFFPCDLSKKKSIDQLITVVKQKMPRIDVLINNAAIQGPIGKVWENNITNWHKTIKINLIAPVYLCQKIIPWMATHKNGSIINISGGGSTSKRPNFSAYSCSKTALVRFTENISEEIKSLGIKINCIAPGAMPTQMLKDIVLNGPLKSGIAEFNSAKKILLKKNNSMKNTFNLCLFLSSSKSKDITGKIISSNWDKWKNWPKHIDHLSSSDLYTLRRITGKDRNISWGDK
jgi:3-oxoacyl-[acyl-carrier protein] reductase